MARLLPLDEALARVLRRATARRRGRVPLSAASGLRLARPLRADRDLPPFDRATVDGYAVRAADPAAGRRPLALLETVFAGSLPRRAARDGATTLVMTGAPLPRGADAVVKREDARLLGGGLLVLLPGRPRRGSGVHRRAGDARKGDVLLPAGTLVTPRVAAVLAAAGDARPEVLLPPRVAIGVTGDELRPVAARRLPAAAIRNSNGPTLEALVRAAGAVPIPLGVAGDRERDLLRLLRRGLNSGDVVVLSGGVSMGDRDLVPAVLRRAGVRRVFHGIDLRPGKPTWFGAKGRTLVFALPGNPVSVQTTFALLVAPALAALGGSPAPALLPAILEGSAPREGRRTAFLPASLSRAPDGSLRARLLRWNGSGDLVGFARADAFLRRAGGAPPLRRGAKVEVLPL